MNMNTNIPSSITCVQPMKATLPQVALISTQQPGCPEMSHMIRVEPSALTIFQKMTDH